MKNKNLFLLLIFVLTVIFTGCKKDDDPYFAYRTQGFIKGTITGTASDGPAINETFNYNKYSDVMSRTTSSVYEVFSNGSVMVSFDRHDVETGGSVNISFGLANLTSTTPLSPIIEVQFQKGDAKQVTSVSINSASGNTSSITNLKFDSTTGRITGNFSLSGDVDTSATSATVIGEFDVVLRKIIH